jgi:hypothetical protein
MNQPPFRTCRWIRLRLVHEQDGFTFFCWAMRLADSACFIDLVFGALADGLRTGSEQANGAFEPIQTALPAASAILH